jgi:hypothetical protein
VAPFTVIVVLLLAGLPYDPEVLALSSLATMGGKFLGIPSLLNGDDIVILKGSY